MLALPVCEALGAWPICGAEGGEGRSFSQPCAASDAAGRQRRPEHTLTAPQNPPIISEYDLGKEKGKIE